MKRFATVTLLTALATPIVAAPALATDRVRLTAQNPEEASVLNWSDGQQTSSEYRR
ncbi:MAG: hypothetical protein VKK04_25480 [Synechococcales bacterium]|nr:hypothetical protein [Synechococcales bacterium]